MGTFFTVAGMADDGLIDRAGLAQGDFGYRMRANVSRGLHPTVHEVLRRVCEAEGVTMADMLSARRHREIARPRQMAMYLAREMTLATLPMIGRVMRRDHTTVLHGVRTIRSLMERDAAVAASIAAIRGKALERAE